MAAAGSWVLAVASNRPSTGTADSWPAAADKPAAIVAAGKPVVTAAVDKPVVLAAADKLVVLAAADNPPAVAGSSREVVDNRSAPGNLPAADKPAVARWQMWRSRTARAPPARRKPLCPYRRPRTRWGADGAPVVAGAAVPRPGSPL